MAQDVQNNDVDAVLDHILFTEEDIKQYARARMSDYRFRCVDIKPNLDLAMDMQRIPPKAVAAFNVVVEVENLGRPPTHVRDPHVGSRPGPLEDPRD